MTTKSSAALLLDLAERASAWRILQNQTQAAVARAAGVGLMTMTRFEKGENISLDSFMRIMAVLKLEHAIISAIPEVKLQPLDLAQSTTRLKPRQRARRKIPATNQTWVWGDHND